MNKKKMLSAYTIVFIFLLITAVLTWIVPQSVVVTNESGIQEVIYNAIFDSNGEIINDLKIIYPNQKINFSSKKSFINSDYHLIRQLFLNLIENAIKYGRDKEIYINIRENKNIIVDIIDNGEGISQENLKHIFDRFFRVDKARSREMKSHGLGLSIVKKIVETLSRKAKEYGFEYTQHDYLKSIYVPLDSELITTLMSAYQEITGDMESQPVASGGATYARAMNNCVAFGCVLPGSPKTEHQPNEYIILDDIKKAMKIYMKAFEKFNK